MISSPVRFLCALLATATLPVAQAAHLTLRQDGVSLASLVRGEKPPAREALYWHFPHYSNHGMQSPGGAIRYGDFKLLEYFENNTVQLFNLREDIGEQRDLSAEQPALTQKLTTMLRQWRQTVSAAMMDPNPDHKGQP